ncbi:MAG: PAS domain-containing sensor histidine kinase [Arcobacteraceae bacterium]|nr:PAS domain-containing sensor histidine kinase [Arcobacteraceae bacterium]
MKISIPLFISIITPLFAQEASSESFLNSQSFIFTIILVIVIYYFIKKEKNLEKSYHQIEAVINTTIESIIVSQNYKCIDFNESALKLFKITNKHDALGKHPLDFIAQESKELVKKKIILDNADLYEAMIVTMDGEKIPVLLKGTNIIVDGKHLRISSIIDISELKDRESKLISQSKLASMGEMIGNIAHQWRQPLSVISTSATGMHMQKEMGLLTDDEFYKYCEVINEHSQFLSQTIDDFRNFIKGDSKPVRFDLKNDTDSFIKLVDATIKRNNITIILDLEENIHIQGYPNELIQCFMNIFNNAKDALVENNDEDDRFIFISQIINENNVIIEFKDNAGGIPEDIIDKVFEPYFTTKHKSQGTGLGLHMSYNLVTNGMKGTLEVKNDEYDFNGKHYKGACFGIVIPLNIS